MAQEVGVPGGGEASNWRSLDYRTSRVPQTGASECCATMGMLAAGNANRMGAAGVVPCFGSSQYPARRMAHVVVPCIRSIGFAMGRDCAPV
jgi:hypothetical protein